MSNAVATVSYLQGQAWAKSLDGSLRPLHLGDWLNEGEVVVTAEGARVELQFTNGDQLDVEGGQEVAMSRDLSLETATAIDEAMLDDASVDKALSALEQKAMTLLDDGEDLLEELEETAAGESSGGGSGNEGHNFIQLARVIESTDPQAFQYDAANRGEFEDPSTESEIFANNNDDESNTSPVVREQDFSVAEDQVLNGQISATDLEGDSLSYNLTTDPANGVLTLDPTTGEFVYTPNQNFHGVDNFTVSITDAAGNTVSHTIALNVTSVNDAPTTSNITLDTTEEASVQGQISAADLDGDSPGFSIATAPVNGNVSIDAVSGLFTYTPNANFSGTDTFVVSVFDGQGGITTSVVTINVGAANDAPVINTSALSTNEDVPLAGQINAVDPDGDTLAYGLVGQPTHGTLSLNPETGAYVYTPNTNYHGNDSFVVRVTDSQGASSTRTINVTVTAVNDAPVASNQNVATTEDSSVSGTITASDVESNSLSYSVTTTAANGSVVLNTATGAFTYTPAANFHGSDSFVVTISDGNSGTTTSTINVTVDPVNDAPIAQASSFSVAEDAAVVNGSVAATDADANAVLSYSLNAAAPAGLTFNADGSYSFDASDAAYQSLGVGESQVLTIGYTVTDDQGASSTADLVITVTGTNDAPTSADQNLTTNEDTPLTGNIVASDLDGDTLAYSVSTGAANGSVSLDPLTGAFTYSPNVNFNGSDSFVVTISDGNGGTTTSTINVGVSSVNDPSVITPATANLIETNSALTTSGTLVITDVDGPTPAFVPQTNVLGAAGYGRFTLQADGDWTYTTTSAQNQFAAGVTYTDTFTVTASDGSTSTITVNILGTNDAPSLTSMVTSRSYVESTGSGVTRTILDSSVTLTDTDSANFDGGSVTVTINNVVAGEDQLTVQTQGTGTNQISVVGADVLFNSGSGAVSIGTISGGTGGVPLTISLNSNATPVAVDALVQRIAYGNTSQLPDTTPRSLTLTIVDGDGSANGGTDTRTHNLTVNVTSSNDAPTLDALSGTHTHVEGGAAVVLDNNATLNDPELALMGNFGGMTLTVGRRGGINADDDFVGSGSLSFSGGNVILAGVTVGTYDATAYANGQLVVTFANGATNAQATSVLRQIAYSHGSDNPPSSVIIDFIVSDGNSGAQGTGSARNSPTRSVRVNITPTTDPAVLGADTGDVKEDTPAQASATGVLSITDYDPGQAAFQTQTNTMGTYGLFSINSTGNWTYNIDNNNPLVQALKEGETKTDIFIVRSIDGTQTTVTITVTGTNDAPVAGNQSLSTAEDTALNGTISVTDIDGDNLAYVVSTPAANGTVTIDPVTGEFVYTPDADFNGTDSFVVTISDGNGGTTTSTITVNVTPVNDAPVANDDSFTTNEDTPILFNLADLRANDTDVDGDPITVISAFSAVNGTLSIIGGQLAFTPNANYSGPASFSYMITDGNGATDTATVNITVNAVDDPSVLGADTQSAAEDSTATGNVLTNDSDVETTLSVVSFTIAGVTGSFTAGQTATITNVGSFTLDGNGDYTFTPDANWNGSVPQITYTTNTGSSSTLDITVTPVNDAPVANDDSFTTNEDTPILFNLADLRANDTDVDGDPITVISAFNAVNGTLSIIGGQLAFTPNANYNGPASFTYMITDGNGATDTATVNITVTPVDDASLLVADAQTIVEDAVATGNVLSNDSDIDNTLSITNFQIAGNATVFTAGQTAVITSVGTFTIESNGDYTFTPDANWNGSVPQVTYTTNTGSTSTLDLSVTPVNDAPIAQAASFSVAEDSAIVNGSVVATDADVGAVLIYSLDAAAPAGLTFNADGTYSFDASNAAYQSLGVGQSVILTIPYTVTDDQGATSNANLEITVNGTNDAAVITPATANLTETNTVLTTSGTVSISDVDSPATFIAQTNAAGSNGYGTFTIDTNGSWIYTANTAHNEFVAGTTYTDSITIASADGTTSTITVNILGTNDAALISGTNTANLTETNAIQSTGGTLTILDVDSAATFVAQTNVSGSNGYGKFTIGTNGVWTYTMDTAHNEFVAGTTYTDSITVASADGTTSTITVNILGTNDAAVISGTNTANLTETNAIQSTGGTLTISDVDSAATFVAQTNVSGNNGYGKFTIGTNGVWTYTMDTAHNEFVAGTTYTDSITVASADGTTSTITVNILGTNDAAIIGGTNTANLTETNAIQGTGGTLTVSDVDSAATFIAQTNVAGSNGYGKFTIGTNGVWTYTMDTAHNEFVAGTTYTDSITVASADGTIHTLTVNMLGTNDAPVAIASTVSGNEDAAFITLSLSGSDVDGSIASLKVTTLPTAAQGVLYLVDGITAVTTAMNLTSAQAAALKFVPTANYNGTVTIPFTVTDNSGSTSTSANATITVNSVNDAPDAVNDQAAGTASSNTGLLSEYYSYREGTHGGNLVSLSQIHDFITGRTPDATFTATRFDYGSTNPFSNDLGRGTNLQTFLGSDAASLSADPGDSSDAIIRMKGFVELAAGTYNFKIYADDGYQIRVDGVVVAEVNQIQSPTGTVHAQFSLSTSGMHNVEIIYWDQGGQAVFKVELSDNAGTTYNLMSSMPTSKNTVFSVVEDTSFSVPMASILANDTDLDGDTLTVTSVQGAVNGTVQIVGSNIVFTPAANYSGPASFTYTISDGKGGSDTATVSLSVAPVNDAPVAVNNTAGVATNSSVVITAASLLANDTDVDGDTLSFVSAQNAVNGSVSVSGTNITFTPTAGFEGAGSFTYTIRDQHGATSTATVNVAIGSATAPALVVSKSIIALAQGTAGTSVAFPIISALVDTDGSETLSARISNVPTSITFNAGTNLGGGVWSFSAADLPNLMMNVPGSYTTPGFTGTDLTVSAITTETNGQTATTSTTVRFSADYTTSTLTAATPAGSVTGTTGDDYITGGSGDNTLAAGAGNDLVYGNDGADTITGADGYDVLYGGAGNDVITAGNGRDRIIGGAGNDTLLGGTNSTADTTVDVFAWSLGDQGAAGAPAVDTIQGFGTGAAASGDGGDVLDLRDLLSGDVVGASNGAGNLANFLHFEISGGNTIIHISHNGGFGADSHNVGGSYTSSAETQQIVLTGVNLQTLYSGATTDAAIITNLLNNNKLITD